MPAPPPQLSVVVCTYNRAELLGECLESLAVQTVERSRFEVIVVDNNSTDNTSQVAAAWGQQLASLRLLREARQGLSHARNLGWQSARGEIVAYLDDDAVAAPDWCEMILQAFRRADVPPVAVGGVIVPRLKRTPPWWYVPRLETRQWGGTAGFLRPPEAAYGFSGSNMAIARKVFTTTGGFSPDFGMRGATIDFGEETDFFARLYREAPFFWYDPAIKVFHLVSDAQLSLAGRLRRVFRGGRARRRYQRMGLSLPLLMGEARGFWDAFQVCFSRREGGGRYGLVLLAERIANRIGYWSGGSG